MAKIALVRYGSRGQGPRNKPDASYVYVVSDTARTGKPMSVVATNWKSGLKFATTGVAQSTSKETSSRGKKYAKSTDRPLTRAYSAKELGVANRQSDREKLIRGGNVARYKEQNPSANFYKKSLDSYEKYSKKYM